MEIIGKHQQPFRLFHVFRFLLFHRHQLINRIENLLLDTGSGIQGILGDDPVNLLIHSFCSSVSVAICIAQYPVLPIKQHIIHRPGINSHGLRHFSRCLAGLQPRFDLFKQPGDIPAQMTILFIHTVFKPVDLFQLYSAVFQMPQNMPAAGSSDIHRKIIFSHNLPLPSRDLAPLFVIPTSLSLLYSFAVLFFRTVIANLPSLFAGAFFTASLTYYA